MLFLPVERNRLFVDPVMFFIIILGIKAFWNLGFWTQVVIGSLVLGYYARKRFRPRKDPRNKAIFITGCDTGMGHRMARRFDELGMRVFAGCLQPNGEGALQLKDACSERLHVVPLDITNDQQVRRAVEYVEANLPLGEKGLHCLINNAGVLAYTDFDLMTLRMCEEVISINLMGPIRVTKHFLPLLCRGPGRIVTITSIHARTLYPRTALYSATKHAQEGFFSSLRYELQDKGVHVSNLEPGNFSRTTDIMQWTRRHLDEMWEGLSSEERVSKRPLFESTKLCVDRAVQGKCPEAEREAHFRYLLSDAEDAVLGENPQWRYVSGPLSLKVAMGLLLRLPEKWAFALSKKILC